jgi:dolichol-phosphate mannosyltransferase
MTLSVVSPVYNSANTIYVLTEEIIKSVSEITKDFEIILVDDGSKDESWKLIESVGMEHSYVKGIKLSENYGQHQAICAGLENAKGEWLVVLDCDLQDNPSEIPNLYSKTKDDFQIVLAKRMNRKDTFFKKSTSYIFWKMISFLSKTNIHPLVGNFGIYHKTVISRFLESKKTEPYFSIAMQKFDFKKCYLDIEHQERKNQNSSYSLFKLIKHGIHVLMKTCGFQNNNFHNFTIEKKVN